MSEPNYMLTSLPAACQYATHWNWEELLISGLVSSHIASFLSLFEGNGMKKAQKDTVIERIMVGETLYNICLDLGVAYHEALDFIDTDSTFRSRYKKACEIRADHYHDKALTLANSLLLPPTNENPDDIESRRPKYMQARENSTYKLIIDTLKWGSLVGNPEKYAGKIIEEDMRSSEGFTLETGVPRPEGFQKDVTTSVNNKNLVDEDLDFDEPVGSV